MIMSSELAIVIFIITTQIITIIVVVIIFIDTIIIISININVKRSGVGRRVPETDGHLDTLLDR